MKLVLPVLFFLFAGSTDVQHWTNAELKNYAVKLQPSATAKVQVASQALGDWGSHNMSIGRRTNDGEAELHEGFVDIFVVQAGEATLVTGGAIENPRTEKPGEIRGSGIKGGEKRTLRPGDIVRIPNSLPHQVQVQKDFTYFVIKVKP